MSKKRPILIAFPLRPGDIMLLLACLDTVKTQLEADGENDPIVDTLHKRLFLTYEAGVAQVPGFKEEADGILEGLGETPPAAPQGAPRAPSRGKGRVDLN